MSQQRNNTNGDRNLNGLLNSVLAVLVDQFNYSVDQYFIILSSKTFVNALDAKGLEKR